WPVPVKGRKVGDLAIQHKKTFDRPRADKRQVWFRKPARIVQRYTLDIRTVDGCLRLRRPRAPDDEGTPLRLILDQQATTTHHASIISVGDERPFACASVRECPPSPGVRALAASLGAWRYCRVSRLRVTPCPAAEQHERACENRGAGAAQCCEPLPVPGLVAPGSNGSYARRSSEE